MTETGTPPTSKTDSGGRGLARNAIGTKGLVFFVVAAAAPLTVMAGVAPLAIGLGGAAAPLGYLIPGVFFMLFAAGYTAMSRHVRNAGAFYAYIGQGLGKPVGVGAALVAVLCYNLIEIGLLAAFAFFTESTLQSLFGVYVPWQVVALVAIAVIAVIGYFRLTLSTGVLAVALILEVAILLVLEVPVLAAGGGGASGLSLEPFDPSGLLTAGVASMLVLSAGAFLGFESTAIYAEETRDPDRTVPRATYAAVAFLALFYTFTVWTIISAYGVDRAVEVAQSEDAADMVFAATADYAGPLAADIMRLLIVTSAFAATLAWHNASARYMFALGRERVLPSALGRTSARHGSPVAGVLAQSLAALVVIGIGIIAQADPYLVILLWTNGPGILGVLLLQALTSVAVIGFFRTDRRGFSTFRTVVAPALGALGLGAIVVLSAWQIDLLTAASWTVNLLLLLPIPILFVVGLGLALRIRDRDPRRYEALTTTVVDNP